MPLPTVLFLAFAAGLAAALAARTELKISPRPSLVTRGALAFLIFDFLVLVPASAYFYVFHGDWFLLYAFDVRLIPSAIALIGFVFEGLLAALGFVLGAGLVRSQREAIGGGLVMLSTAAAIAVPLIAAERLKMVGSYAQYTGNFGLVPFASGPLLLGTITMSGIVVFGLAFLLLRIWMGARRQL
jgi:hypothetical protein